LDVAVIGDPAAAEVSLDPVRARLLAELGEPASVTMLADRAAASPPGLGSTARRPKATRCG
jgi:hypothetical protein